MDVGLRRKLARHLRVDRNDLYRTSAQAQKDEGLKQQIEAVLCEHKHYGYRRVALHLGISKNRAQRVMHTYNIHPEPSPHQRYYKQHKGIRPAPTNVLKEQGIVANRPNHVWACDFTYLWCLGRWYYLATVIDVFTREIVGWSVSTRHNTKLILAALYDGLSRHQTPVYLHFDRGSEYLSEAHFDLCASLEITVSASAAGSPWQNGFQERFYGSFKTELGSLQEIQSEGELYEQIAVTLNYYNTKRIHTKLKTTPKQYRQNYNDQQKSETLPETEVRDKVLQISGS